MTRGTASSSERTITEKLAMVVAQTLFAGHFSQSVWKTFFEGFFEECNEEYDEEYASDFRP